MKNLPHNTIEEPLIYDGKLGYVTQKRLNMRELRADTNRLSFTAMGFFGASLIGTAIVSIMVVFSTLVTDNKQDLLINSSPEFLYLFSAFLTVLGMGIPFMIFLLVRRARADEYLRFDRIKPGLFIVFVIAGSGLCMLMNIPAGMLASFLEGVGLAAPQSDPSPITTPISAFLAIFSTALLPAIFEEFAFRGVMLSAFRKYGDVFAIVTSSLVFGLVHMDISTSVFAIGAGLIMGYAFVRTGNLAVSIVIHFLNNSVAVILNELSLRSDSDLSSVIMLLLIAVGIVLLIILGISKKLTFKPGKSVISLTACQKVSAVFTNPGFLLLTLVCVTFSIYQIS